MQLSLCPDCSRLHYVRNHAAVPQLNWETHTISVFSEPPELLKPKAWSMDDLAGGKLRVIEIPVTFACDGSTYPFPGARCRCRAGPG